MMILRQLNYWDTQVTMVTLVSDRREELMVAVEDLVRRIFGPHLRRRHKPADLDLTLGQLECLRAISDLGAPSMSDLSRALGLHPSSVTGLVDNLVAAGKVERRADADDRRVVRVVLTAQGRRERDRHQRLRRKRLRRLLAALDDEELSDLHRALAVLAEAAERAAPR
ncbi:MAG: MarR family winged helix-turn-helix transcriptional regulator [Armatimonadota bacterium]